MTDATQVGDIPPGTDTTEGALHPESPEPQVAGFRECDRCGMRVRSEELPIHLAHAHNIDMDAKKSKKKPSSRDRRR